MAISYWAQLIEETLISPRVLVFIQIILYKTLSDQATFYGLFTCVLCGFSVSILLLELDLWDPKSSPHSPLSQKILQKLQVRECAGKGNNSENPTQHCISFERCWKGKKLGESKILLLY